MNLIFQEGDYLVKTLLTKEELEASFRLRHEVFCNELKWVPPMPNGMERDSYDNFAESVGVFDKDMNLIGNVRLISAPDRFMLEKEFSCLLPKDKHFKKLPGMVESTRICLKADVRNTEYQSMNLVYLIYKGMYHWSLQRKLRYLVTVIERRYYLLVKRQGLPFEKLGDFDTMGDGVICGAVTMDWRGFEEALLTKKPDLFRWFSNLSIHFQGRLLLHDAC